LSGLLWGLLGVLGGFGLAAIGDMVSEEVRDRLDHLPNAILHLAGRRLDPAKRKLLYEEAWLPDLAYHLRGDEARPVTRLYHGTCFALGMLASARRSSRNLGNAAPHRSDEMFTDANAISSAVHTLRQFGDRDFRFSISGNRLSVAGESDLRTEEALEGALLALGKVPATLLVLDITGLSFASINSLCAVLQFAEDLNAPRQLEVRCSSRFERLLLLLEGNSISQLSITTLLLWLNASASRVTINCSPSPCGGLNPSAAHSAVSTMAC
jgi:hypothetical protein